MPKIPRIPQQTLTCASKRVAIYARVSSDRQADEETIESQLDQLRQRVAADGFVLTPEMTFIDDGFSGEKADRPAFNRLCFLVDSGGCDRVYVTCPDRFMRYYAYQIVIYDDFLSKNVEVVFLNRQIDNTPEGRMLLQVQSMFAEYEHAKIRERCRRGRLYAAKMGKISVFSHAPYGYHYQPKEPTGQAAFVVIPDEAQVVQNIFNWMGNDNCSLMEVCRRLENQGILTRKGNTKWDRATVRGMVKNPAYWGMACFGKVSKAPATPGLRPRRGVSEHSVRYTGKVANPVEDQIKIPVPAIVSQELFAKVQEQLKTNQAHPGQTRKTAKALLGGLVVCEGCGYAYIKKQVGGKAYANKETKPAYYRCCGSVKKVCQSVMIRAERLEAAVWADVKELLTEPKRLKEEFARRMATEVKAVKSPMKTVRKELGQVKTQIPRILDMYQKGYIDGTELERRMSALRVKEASLEKDMVMLEEEANLREEQGQIQKKWEEFGEEVRGELEECSDEKKREIMIKLIKHISVKKGAVQVVYKIAPNEADFSRKEGIAPLCLSRASLAQGVALGGGDNDFTYVRHLAP